MIGFTDENPYHADSIGFFYKRLVFQWVRIAPLIADLFLHAYKADFLQGFFKNKDRKLAQTINYSFHYVDVYGTIVEAVKQIGE
jgi:hypothetical protein